MRWEDERYVRVYTRDTLDMLALSFEAQGLLVLLFRKVDRAGLLRLGKHGARGVAAAIGHATRWAAIEPALNELLADGCVKIVEGPRGPVLVIPNFIEAQEAKSSDTARQATKRERDRDKALAAEIQTPDGAPTPPPAPPPEGAKSPTQPVDSSGPQQTVTPARHAGDVTLGMSRRDVTQESHVGVSRRSVTPARHAGDVTPSHAVPAEPLKDTTRASAPVSLVKTQLELEPEQQPLPDLDALVYARWRELFSPRASPELDDTRRKIIRKRRKRFSQEQLLDALDGWTFDPWEQRRENSKLSQLFRDDEQIEKALELKRRRPLRKGVHPEAYVGRASDTPEPEEPLPPCRVPGCGKLCPDKFAAIEWGLCRPGHTEEFLAWQQAKREASRASGMTLQKLQELGARLKVANWLEERNQKVKSA